MNTILVLLSWNVDSNKVRVSARRTKERYRAPVANEPTCCHIHTYAYMSIRTHVYIQMCIIHIYMYANTYIRTMMPGANSSKVKRLVQRCAGTTKWLVSGFLLPRAGYSKNRNVSAGHIITRQSFMHI